MTLTKPLICVLGSLLLAGCSLGSPPGDPPEAVGRFQAALSGVTWTDVVGVDANGSSLTKTGAPGWNAGAASVQSLDGDGNAQFTTGEANTWKIAGLTHAVTDSSYDDIDFGILMAANGSLVIFEKGASLGVVGTYAASDVLEVQVIGTQVTYLQNGNLLYTSSSTPTFPLVVDASLYDTGATVNNVSLTSSTSSFWQNELGVAVSGESVTDTASTGWGNSGASSISSLSGNGNAQFTTGETSTYKMAGLTHTVTDSSYDDIDFAVYTEVGGALSIYEDGHSVWSGGTYAAGDVFTVQVTGTVVTYLQNGTLLYTSAKTPTLPLYFDAALYSTGATVNNVSLTSTSSFWQNEVGVTVSGQSLTKSASSGWGNSGASSISSLSGNGNAQFTTGETSTYKMAGLTHTVTDSSYDDIDFAVYTEVGGVLSIYEDAHSVWTGGTYAAGDVFTVEVTGTVVTYLQNGTLLYTSAKTPTLPLYFDAALYSTGATVNNVSLTSAAAFWQDAVGVEVSGASLTDTASTGWGNSGASSISSLSGSGNVQFTTGEANTWKIAGLTHAVTDNSYDDIDFGILMTANGSLVIFEGGVSHGVVGTYAASDVLEVQVVGTQVTYLQNGNLLHTSGSTPTFPLVVDAALYDTGATINNVVLTP